MIEILSILLSLSKRSAPGAARLKEFKNLRHLGLDNTQITDVGLLRLREMTHLDCLDVSGPRMTDEGLTKLFKALPKVGHQHGGGAIGTGPPSASGGMF